MKEALRAWIKQYVEGYRKHPESISEVKAWSRLAGHEFHKDPW